MSFTAAVINLIGMYADSLTEVCVARAISAALIIAISVTISHLYHSFL